jgi:hypothetical protein
MLATLLNFGGRLTISMLLSQNTCPGARSKHLQSSQYCSTAQDADKTLSPLHNVLTLGHEQTTITHLLKFWDLFYSSKARDNWKSTPNFNLSAILSSFSQTFLMTVFHPYGEYTSSAAQHGNISSAISLMAQKIEFHLCLKEQGQI